MSERDAQVRRHIRRIGKVILRILVFVFAAVVLLFFIVISEKSSFSYFMPTRRAGSSVSSGP